MSVRLVINFCIAISLLFLHQAAGIAQEVSILLDSAGIYMDSGKVANAERVAKLALDLSRRQQNRDEVTVADAHYWVGYARARQGRIDSAREELEEALVLYERNLEKGDPRTGAAYSILASILIDPDPGAGLLYARKLLANRIARHQRPHVETAYAHRLLSRYYSREGAYDSVYHHSMLSIENHRGADSTDFEEYGQTYNGLGWYYENRGDLHRARLAFEKSDSIFHLAFPPDHIMHSNTCIAYGIIQQAEHKYQEAISNTLKALQIRSKTLDEPHPSLAYCYQLLGLLYTDMKDHARSMAYNRKCIQMLDAYNGPDNRWSANLYSNQGNNYLAIHKPDSALFCFRKAIRDNTAVLGPDNYELVYPLKGMADAYTAYDQPDSAMYYLRACHRLCRKIYGDSYRTTLEAQTGMAELALAAGNTDEAMAMIDGAIASTGYDARLDLPFGRVSYPVVLLDALRVRSATRFAQFEASGDIDELKKAHDDIRVAETLTRHTRNSFSEIQSRQILAGNSLGTFEQGLRVAFALFERTGNRAYLDDAFRYCEQNKSLTILEAIQNARAERFAGVPETILDELRALQFEIASLETEISGMGDHIDPEKAGRLGDMRTMYTGLLSEVEQEYPEYYALKYRTNPPSLDSVQEWLREHDASLVEYFAGDGDLAVFFISGDTVMYALREIPSINRMVRRYIADLRDPGIGTGALQSAGDSLFLALFDPFQEYLDEQVIIIPDGLLGYLPFGALAAEAGIGYQWLVERYTFTYGLSTTLLLQAGEMAGLRGGVTAFAPTYSAANSFSPLRYNMAEVAGINKVAGGKTVTGDAATRSRFLDRTERTSVLHLATHAQANDAIGEESCLIFAPGDSASYLYVRDLYNVDIPVQLAVLSACETGAGELRRGEGMISLARGFAFAGARAVVTTLWPVNDEVTAGIMEAFYRGLKRGDVKHDALAAAQRSFLANVDDPQLAHPYYWAPYILIGDPAPVALSGFQPLLWIGGAMLLILLVFLYWRYGRERQ